MCCGSARAAARVAAMGAGQPAAASAGNRSTSATSVAVFEYVGSGETRIRGPVSGRIYYFRRPGDRLRVDPRDRPGLASLPELRGVR
jgi:hypothetical protein